MAAIDRSDERPGSTGGRAALEQHAPGPATDLRRLCEVTPVDAARTAALRRACAGALGLTGLPPGDGGSPRPGDEVVAEFAGAFSVDVAGIDDQLTARFLQACGDDAFAVAQALYVADQAPRVMAVLDRLFGPSTWDRPDPQQGDATEVWAAIEQLLRSVHGLGRLDAVVSEVVRIRGARQHDCRLCRSLRSRPALAEGATEDTFDAVDEPGWPRLPGRTRTCLALTDAFIWTPARIGDDLVADVHRDLDPAEVVELVLDVMRNAANKIAVALGADAPHVEDGVEVYEIDADGVAHYGLTAPPGTLRPGARR